MPDTSTITIQFLSKLDTIQKDVNRQGMRLERLAAIQETQTANLTKLTDNLDKISAELPTLRGFEQLQKQVGYHDRQLNEQTGRWQAFDHRKRTPVHGTPRSSIPPKRPSFKDLKDWGTIFRMIALTAVISAGVTAALATAGQMGWLGPQVEPVTEVQPIDKTKAVLKQIQELQRLFESLNTPPGDASLPDTTEAVYD